MMRINELLDVTISPSQGDSILLISFYYERMLNVNYPRVIVSEVFERLILDWLLSECEFCQYHLMKKSAIS